MCRLDDEYFQRAVDRFDQNLIIISGIYHDIDDPDKTILVDWEGTRWDYQDWINFITSKSGEVQFSRRLDRKTEYNEKEVVFRPTNDLYFRLGKHIQHVPEYTVPIVDDDLDLSNRAKIKIESTEEEDETMEGRIVTDEDYHLYIFLSGTQFYLKEYKTDTEGEITQLTFIKDPRTLPIMRLTEKQAGTFAQQSGTRAIRIDIQNKVER